MGCHRDRTADCTTPTSRYLWADSPAAAPRGEEEKAKEALLLAPQKTRTTSAPSQLGRGRFGMYVNVSSKRGGKFAERISGANSRSAACLPIPPSWCLLVQQNVNANCRSLCGRSQGNLPPPPPSPFSIAAAATQQPRTSPDAAPYTNWIDSQYLGTTSPSNPIMFLKFLPLLCLAIQGGWGREWLTLN